MKNKIGLALDGLEERHWGVFLKDSSHHEEESILILCGNEWANDMSTGFWSINWEAVFSRLVEWE